MLAADSVPASLFLLMSLLPPFLADLLPAPTDFLTSGKIVGAEVTLLPGTMYGMGFLVGGPLLILGAFVMVWVMYRRVKFFALEFGFGGGWGRIKAIGHFLALGAVFILGGVYLTLIGLQNNGYSVVLSGNGLTEMHPSGTRAYRWTDLKNKSDRVKSTTFFLQFERGSDKCRVEFQQVYLGATVQDRAIEIAETAIAGLPAGQ